jgi:hypothetical protein
MTVKALRKSDLMSHLLDALDTGQAIGHYERLTFAMIAQHFLSETDLIEYLQKDPECSDPEARSLYQQARSKGYSPPKRDRILEWQTHQTFPICPNPDDPDTCNVYRDLTFPDDVYEHISSYYEQKSESPY